MAVKTRTEPMAVTGVAHPSVGERRARGKQGLQPDASSQPHRMVPATDRPDPVGLLDEQNLTREPDLVPVRHGRMLVSPFTFYRGAAKIMAADLAGTPTAGLQVQLSGGCAPVELRAVRLARAGAAVRPERLRRDPAGTVRV